MPYYERLDRRSLRPEELPPESYSGIWSKVREHLGVDARSHAELVEKLGILRFGHRPRIADPFCGGGSIPFEAARIGCDAYASDLNPIACMLTWEAFNIIGADESARKAMREAQRQVVTAVDEKITKLGIEHDTAGNRAKAYLYCLETRCPETGWMVPLAGSWVISKNKRTVAKLAPNAARRAFDIEVITGASDDELAAASLGTVRDADLVYALEGVEHRIPIRTLRGDRRVGEDTVNSLRQWSREDIVPGHGDLFQERLYCVQWVKQETSDTYFTGVTPEDLARERAVEGVVRENLSRWHRRVLFRTWQSRRERRRMNRSAPGGGPIGITCSRPGIFSTSRRRWMHVV